VSAGQAPADRRNKPVFACQTKKKSGPEEPLESTDKTVPGGDKQEVSGW
jgi:hypothetical protein